MSRKKPEKPEKPAADDLRRNRLAEALRANLKRRKAARQARPADRTGPSPDRNNGGD